MSAKTGTADLPLHYGSCPKWLFSRMVKLSRAITKIIVLEYGKDEFLCRLSNPFFFQAFGCVVAFDWHSSGLTTTLTAALKEAISPELGIAVLGGKGKASRKTTKEIDALAEKFSFSTKKLEELKYASRITAKVDNAAVQDGFQLYHHSFFVSENGNWAVIQQGMNSSSHYARRYHWLSGIKSFVVEPHTAVVCDIKTETLNMVAKESEEVRRASIDLINENPTHLKKYFSYKNLRKYLHMQSEHQIDLSKHLSWKHLMKRFNKAYEQQPKTFEQLLAIRGIGPKSIRALALLSNLIFGAEPSWKDPARYSFAHGGKDGTPYFVDRETYDKSIQLLEDGINEAELGKNEKLEAIKRLKEFLK